MFYNIWKNKSFSDEIPSGVNRTTAEFIEFMRFLTCKTNQLAGG